jgi:hypothetical protein
VIRFLPVDGHGAQAHTSPAQPDPRADGTAVGPVQEHARRVREQTRGPAMARIRGPLSPGHRTAHRTPVAARGTGWRSRAGQCPNFQQRCDARHCHSYTKYVVMHSALLGYCFTGHDLSPRERREAVCQESPKSSNQPNRSSRRHPAGRNSSRSHPPSLTSTLPAWRSSWRRRWSRRSSPNLLQKMTVVSSPCRRLRTSCTSPSTRPASWAGGARCQRSTSARASSSV